MPDGRTSVHHRARKIDKSLVAMKAAAAAPPRVTQDFVKTILKIPGGSGDQITAFLRKIGFVNSDGSPSDLYKSFRNPGSGGTAAAKALKIGYQPLYTRNEYMHQLSDDKVRGLIVEETGQSADWNVISLILSSIKAIRKHATWSEGARPDPATEAAIVIQPPSNHRPSEDSPPSKLQYTKVGMNLSYTINLNLPASSDVAVFNAIFKSLKENLLSQTDE